MCGADIINDIAYQALGLSCASKSQWDCESDARCVWSNGTVYGWGPMYGWGYMYDPNSGSYQWMYGLTYGYGPHSGQTCVSMQPAQCPTLGRGDCQMDSACLWDERNLWCFAANVTLSDLYQGCNNGQVDGGKGKVQCPFLPLNNWDGVLPGGQAVFDSRRMSGQAFRTLTGPGMACNTSGSMPLVRLGCDLRLDVLPGTPAAVAAYLPALQLPIAAVVDNIMQFATACSQASAGAAPLTDDQLSANFR